MAGSLERLAEKIISGNLYLTLATASGSGNPWVSPLYFARDKLNFYWSSAADSLHSRLLKHNRKAAVVIFNSASNRVDGVYMTGTAHEINGKEMKSPLLPRTKVRGFLVDFFQILL